MEWRSKGNAIWRLQCKLKKLRKVLSQWCKKHIGDVQEQVQDWEVKIEILEELDTMHNTKKGREYLNDGYAEYTGWINMKDSMLKLKIKL